MSKDPDEIKPNYAPVYACLYPDLAKIFQKHGYALAIHGSLARDFDLIGFKWAEKVSEPQEVIDEILKTFAFQKLDRDPVEKNHGRIAYTVILSFGECQLDISFFN